MTAYTFSIRSILFLLILFSCHVGFSQDSLSTKKSPPILYGEILFGMGVFDNNGSFMCDVGLHYQKKKHLLSLKYTENYAFNFKAIPFTPFLVFLLPVDKGKNSEVSFLYGRRWIDKWASLNLSGGVSLNNFSLKYQNSSNEIATMRDTYVGFPYEISIKFFKAKKRRFRAPYWLIPIGKAGSFGRSVGLKIFGNFSKRNYVGFGCSWGFGFHRKY